MITLYDIAYVIIMAQFDRDGAFNAALSMLVHLMLYYQPVTPVLLKTWSQLYSGV